MTLGEGEATFKEGGLECSETRVVVERSGLLDGETCADLTESVSGRSGGRSRPEMSVTDIFRRFFAARDDEVDGFRMENPSVPKTLRVCFRFAAALLVGVPGTVSAEETSLLADVADWVSLVGSSESSSAGKGSFGALL